MSHCVAKTCGNDRNRMHLKPKSWGKQHCDVFSFEVHVQKGKQNFCCFLTHVKGNTTFRELDNVVP